MHLWVSSCPSEACVPAVRDAASGGTDPRLSKPYAHEVFPLNSLPWGPSL